MLKQQEQENYIARSFRMIMLGPKILHALKDHAVEARMEKMKEQHKQMMWDKVQGWLEET
jgi:flagellar motor component MotA